MKGKSVQEIAELLGKKEVWGGEVNLN
jgi:hypothetical protein